MDVSKLILYYGFVQRQLRADGRTVLAEGRDDGRTDGRANILTDGRTD